MIKLYRERNVIQKGEKYYHDQFSTTSDFLENVHFRTFLLMIPKSKHKIAVRAERKEDAFSIKGLSILYLNILKVNLLL